MWKCHKLGIHTKGINTFSLQAKAPHVSTTPLWWPFVNEQAAKSSLEESQIAFSLMTTWHGLSSALLLQKVLFSIAKFACLCMQVYFINWFLKPPVYILLRLYNFFNTLIWTIAWLSPSNTPMYWSQILELIKLFVFLILIFFVCFSFLMGKPKHTLEFNMLLWCGYTMILRALLRLWTPGWNRDILFLTQPL